MRPFRLRDASLYTIGLAVLLVAAADLAFWHTLGTADARLADVMLRLHARSVPADPAIVVLDIDDRSLAEMADEKRGVGRFPWPRSVYGELIDELERQGAAAIVLDVELYEPDLHRREHDAVLNEALAGNTSAFFPLRLLERIAPDEGVLLAEVAQRLALPAGGAIEPQARAPMLLPFVLDEPAWSRAGYINFLEDRDGIGRRYALACVEGGYAIPSLPARLATAKGWPLPDPDATLVERTRHCSQERSFLLAWPAGLAAHPHVAFVDVYDDLQRSQRTRPADEFRDRIVVVGASATHLRDLRATPIDSLHPGVAILATAIDNLKNGRYLAPGPPLAPWFVLLGLFAPLLAALKARKHLLAIFGVLVIATAAVLGIAYATLATASRVVPVATPLVFAWLLFLLAALRAYANELRAREQRERVLGRFLDPEVVRRLVADGVKVEDFRSESREITVLFSDIRGFTTLSEQHSPERIVDLLNRYLTAQVDTVFQHGGTLDKFIGDAIMALWNAPADDPAHARNATACALAMEETLARFNATLAAEGLTLDIGVGVHTGPAVVGFIGSARRLEYTAIGDTVNLASRIEGATKGRARVLVSEATRERAGLGFRFHDVGEVAVKGRAAVVRLYSVEKDA
jgi:adenylate cyclase